MNHGLLAYCRPGFEPELAAELGERMALAGRSGHARTERGSGFVLFFGDGDDDPSRAVRWRDLVFARQKLRLLAEVDLPDPRDRIAPILAALRQAPDLPRLGNLLVEHPDSDAGRPLAGLARSFGNALRPALRAAGLLAPRERDDQARLHVCFTRGDHALLAIGDPADGVPWQSGIPRLRANPAMPSRSALKLEEALLVLLDDGERARWLRPDMRAADLGAAPGGWSWVLARNGMRVTAIDNGPMQAALLDGGRVEHLRADGFAWQPRQPLDWMVCDMVEQPRRVAERMATWMREGWCRHMIFNLKLPMKKRWDETRLCLDLFTAQAQRPVLLRARQLYHDREEITVLAVARRE